MIKALILLIFISNTAFTTSQNKANILFIAIDDLNDWVGCMKGHPQAQTPHIDDLAKRGMLFTEAHCAAPVCGPSRAAVLSGIATVNNGVYSNNANYMKRLKQYVSLPETFKTNGYHTLGYGKIFHGSTPKNSFHEYVSAFPKPWPKEAILNTHQTPTYSWKRKEQTISFPRNGLKADRTWTSNHTFDWGPLDIPKEEFHDYRGGEWMTQQLSKKHSTPLFLNFGFQLPHQPLFAPKAFHDMYPIDSVILPKYISNDLNDLSQAGKDYALIPTTSGTHASVVQGNQWKQATSSYLATVSFVDHIIGNMISALDQSDYAKNTWIVLWSDHGWHLGEKQHWGKATGWYRATRVPFIIVPPKNNEPRGFIPGQVCEKPVNLLDLYPTLLDIAAIPSPHKLDGASLLPLLSNPKAKWKESTVTTFGHGNHAISTSRWRYIQYFDGSAEFYDRKTDPHEWNNLIHHPEHHSKLEELKSLVPKEPQYKHFIRYKRFKAVVPSDGSEILLYNHAKENHLEGRASEAHLHPDIIEKLEIWLKENPYAPKRINLNL